MLSCFIAGSTNLYSQTVRLDKNKFETIHVSTSIEKLNGKDVVKVIKDSTVNGVDDASLLKIKGTEFKNGTIEVKVLSRLRKHAPEFARGFIGVAFRVNDSTSKFECFYLRPTNGRVDDQLRRNHSIQYSSYPAYDFDRLRNEAPGVYESYADMGLDEWIQMRIEVKGKQAKLFLNNNKQPSLIVNDLKHGDNSSGTIGLWVGTGTEGFFTDLKISNN